MLISIFKADGSRGGVLPATLTLAPGIRQATDMLGVRLLFKKQMKYLEQQQDEAKQAREEARRLRSKMKNMER